MKAVLSKWGVYIGLGILVLAPAAVYSHTLLRPAVWILAWLVVFFLFLEWKFSDLSTRGWVFLIASVFVAIGGKEFVGNTMPDWVSETLSQIILLVGAGIGGALMADHLIREEQRQGNEP